jgi:hypothetical protein
MHDQKSLTLRWHSFSWLGREGIAICFAYKGSHRFLCDWLQPIQGVISQDAWPKIIDALLTLIFLMGQGGDCYLFHLYRQPIVLLWLTTTNWRHDSWGCMTKILWHSVDIHFHHAAGRVLQSVLPIKESRNYSMTDKNLSEVWFRRTHDDKLLTLHWRSFCPGCIRNMQSFNLAQSIIHIVLASFQAISFTFFLITTLFFNHL